MTPTFFRQFLFWGAVLCSLAVSAQERPLSFVNYGVEEGLASSTVTALSRDRDGFVWIGTTRGLHRFDGYRFRLFRYCREEPGSLADDIVSSLLHDSRGRLWVGMDEGGVGLYHPATESFTNIRNAPDRWDVLTHNQVTGIAEAADGRLWVATARGFNLIDPDTLTVRQYLTGSNEIVDRLTLQPLLRRFAAAEREALRTWSHYVFYDRQHAFSVLRDQLGQAAAARRWPQLEALLEAHPVADNSVLGSYHRVSAIHADSLGNVFMGYAGGGVAVYRHAADRPRLLLPNYDREVDPLDRGVLSLLRHHDTLFVGTQDGQLRTVDLTTGQPTANTYQVGGYSVNDIQVQNDRLYLATPIGIVSPRHRREPLIYFQDPYHQEYNLVANECARVLPDGDGNLWVGHFKHGLSYGSPAQPFTSFPDLSEEALPFYMRTVNTVLHDSRGRLWLGYFEGGIRRGWTEWMKYSDVYLAESGAIKRSSVFSIYEDRDGDIWSGGHESGLLLFDTTANAWRVWGGDATALGGYDIRFIIQDLAGKIWVGVHGVGLVQIDKETGAVRRYTSANSGLINSYIFAAHVDDRNKLWFISVLGAFTLDPDRETFSGPLGAERSGSQDRSNCVGGDRRGRVWVGTQNGLRVFGQDGTTAPAVTIPEELREAEIVNVLSRKDRDELWLSSPSLLYQYFPDRGLVYSYELPDHMGPANFTHNSMTQLHEGDIVLGYERGLLRFDPDALLAPREIARPTISDIELFGESGPPALTYDEDGIPNLDMPATNVGFSVDMTTFAYASPDAVSYQVRLVPVQREWQTLENELPRYALYHLNPGYHTLEMRALTDNSSNYSAVSKLRIKVQPYWYSSLTAWIVYSFLMVWFMIWYRGYIRAQAKLKQSVIIREMERQQTQEISRAKARFFVNASHELRTPLTLINGPLQELLRDPGMNDDRRRSYYSLMDRNTRRLRRLVDRLLDLQKIENQAPEVTFVDGNLVHYLRQLLDPFAHRARQAGIDLRITLPDLVTDTNYSPEVLDRICSNLLSNALKFTPAGGCVEFRALLLTEGKEQQLVVEVRDNGPGISAAEQERLFDRFYQAESEQKERGSGVGLAIVKQSVELLGGRVAVESEPGRGAVFTATVPLHRAITAASEVEGGSIGAWSDLTVPEATTDDRPHILVVDDDADIRELIRHGCSDKFRITEATDGEDALAQAGRRQPDLILTDLMMPRMDGIELCNRLKTRPETSHLPVLLLTARHNDEAREAAARAGANDFLTKPFDLQRLLLKIDNTLRTMAAARRHWSVAPRDLVTDDLPFVDADQEFLLTLRNYIEEHMGDSDLSTDELLRVLAVSRSVCYAKVKALTGLPLKAYVKKLKINRAQQLLRQTEAPVGEIAYGLGFKTTQHFSRTFKNVSGQSPSEYRQG